MNENHEACSGQDASFVAVDSADSSRSDGTSGFLCSERFESEKEVKGDQSTHGFCDIFRAVHGLPREEVMMCCRGKGLFQPAVELRRAARGARRS